MKPLIAVIVDDEQDSVDLLALQIRKNCPQIEVTHEFTNPQDALRNIEFLQPDIIFLDIEMPGMNGFQLLEKLIPLQVFVIFVTAYNRYAIKAFRFNALDYLVKPVSSEDLITAVKKATDKERPVEMQLKLLQKQMNGDPIHKIAVATQTGISFITLANILYIEANSNYSTFHMLDGTKYVITKTLKSIQEVLEEKHFFRIHRQYIVNLNMIKHFNRTDCMLTLDNGVELSVARIQREKLIDKFGLL